MKTTIKTRSIGNLEFSITKEGGYLKVWDNESKKMKQCMSDGFFGSSISSTSETIAKDARRWWAKNKNCFA